MEDRIPSRHLQQSLCLTTPHSAYWHEVEAVQLAGDVVSPAIKHSQLYVRAVKEHVEVYLLAEQLLIFLVLVANQHRVPFLQLQHRLSILKLQEHK